jgi:hypothetical protein
VPSADPDPDETASAHGAHTLPAAADPPCPGCSRN